MRKDDAISLQQLDDKTDIFKYTPFTLCNKVIVFYCWFMRWRRVTIKKLIIYYNMCMAITTNRKEKEKEKEKEL
jgi:hypothetical protein